jgi:hypothetical protein
MLENGQMLYLHAGTVKTGTTYLQKTFHENRAVFERHGLAYLQVSPSDLELPRYANAKFLFDRSLAQEVSGLICSAAVPNVLVSEEGIFGNVEHLRHSAFQGLPKRIILYVRPTAEVLSSWAADFSHPYQIVTFPGDAAFHPTGRRILPLNEALDVASHEYALSLGRFMNIVDEIGRENFIVRPFERASFLGKNLLTDFLACLGLDADAVCADPDFRDPGLTNVAPSRKFCDVSQFVWLNLGRPNELIDFNYGLVEAVVQACASGDSRPVVETLTDEQIAWVTYRFDHFESYISKTFLDGRPLFQNRYPPCYGVEREPYRPINVREVELLNELIRLRGSS